MEMRRFLAFALVAVLTVSMASCHREDPELDLGSSSSSIAALAQGGSATVSFTCNYKWTASASDPWIKVSPASGEKGSNTITITVDANTGNAVRSGKVNIQCEDLTRSISVKQAQPFNQTLTLVFTGTSAVAPLIMGNSLSGEIDWGDGSKETYVANSKHDYGSAGSHTVTIKLAGGGSFEIGTVADLSEIDLSEF